MGPREKWSYFRGHAFEGMAENFTVVAERGPFALWMGGEVKNPAVLTGRLQFDRQLEVASIILRARPVGDLFHGYEVRLDPRQGKISLARVADKVETLGTADLPGKRGDWFKVSIDLDDDRIRVWLADRELLLLDTVDPTPLPAGGQLGIRCWGGEFRLDRLSLRNGDGESFLIEGDPVTATPEDRALAAFCNLVYNLNEFVYVD